MMSYKLFKQLMAAGMIERLPAEFTDSEMKTCSAGIKILDKALEELYVEFQQCQDLDKVLNQAVMIVTSQKQLQVQDLKNKEDCIIMSLVNTEMNAELLQTIPHQQVMDLSVIYSVLMGEIEDGFETLLIDYEILKKLEIDPGELSLLACKNTERIFPPKITKVTDVFFTLTNRFNCGGATAMLYENAANLMAEELGGNFYIIPCSVHDVIAVREKDADLKQLIEMLAKGNQICAPGDAILSNSIYHYSREKCCFQIAATYCPR